MKKHIYTEKEMELVRTKYLEIGASRLASMLHVSRSAIYGLARELKITRSIWKWSKEDDIRLSALLTNSNPIEAAKLMKRTYESIESRMRYLGITKYNGHDWYTLKQLILGFGIDGDRLRGFIKNGKLKAKLYHPENHTEHGWWKIQTSDLIDFIRRYPLELQGRNVDMLWFVDLLVGVKYDHQIEHSYSGANSGIIDR